MTKLYLIRHAEAEGNLYRIVQGQDNSNLTDRGWRQVRALEKRFADVKIDAVYASDLYRTCATASAVYLPKGLPLHRRKDLREICVGAWEHLTWGDVYRLWPEEMDLFIHDPAKWSAKGAETAREVQERGLAALRDIAGKNQGKTVAVVTHGYLIRLVLAALEGLPLEEAGRSPTGDNTAVSLVEAENGELRLLSRDDNSHLKTPDFLAGEKLRKHANGLESGLWFRKVSSPEQAELYCSLAEESWPEGGRPGRETLLKEAAERTTLIGYSREEPVGVLQMGPERNRIARLLVRPDQRRHGFGVQLLGQAVYLARPQGEEALRIDEPGTEEARSFLKDYGFLPDGEGRLSKHIGFDPRFQ